MSDSEDVVKKVLSDAVAGGAVMLFVEHMIGAFNAGFTNRNYCYLSELHQIAKHHVFDNYGVHAPNVVEKYGIDVAKDIGLEETNKED